MTLFEGIVLGVVQGLTEFLPVSSSGHLVLMQQVFGFTELEKYVFFDLVVHLGTLLAILVVFWKSVLSILTSRRIYILYIAVGVFALIPFSPLFPFLKSFYGSPDLIGFFFIATALLLLLGELSRKYELLEAPGIGKKTFQAILVGAIQVLAILPGVSRSGSTVSAARMLGWNPKDAAEFSFLLAVPVIILASMYEGYKVWTKEIVVEQVSLGVYAAGFISAFIVGVFALKLFLRWLSSGKFKYFAIYCVILGVFCLFYFNR